MRSHQADVAALEQWKPLCQKMAFKAAKRAAAIGIPLDAEDFAQEMRMTVLRCHDSFDETKGVKMITFLYRAMYNEMNKIFDQEERQRWDGGFVKGDDTYNPVYDGEGNEIPEDEEAKARRRQRGHARKRTGFKVSGDTTWSSEDGTGESAWNNVEDDTYRSPEHSYLDAELVKWTHEQVSGDASAALRLLQSGDKFVTQQLAAYNAGVQLEAEQYGIRRLPANLDLPFVCKLLGFGQAKRDKIGEEIKQAVALYGSQ